MASRWYYTRAMTVNLGLRLPDELHDRLKAAAENDLRSLHSEILWLLDRSLADRDAPAEPAVTNGH